MRTIIIWWLLVVSFYVYPEGIANIGKSDLSLLNKTEEDLIELLKRRHVSFDPQIPGFNSSFIITGPIVVADLQTIFIPDVQIFESGNTLLFWADVNNTKQFLDEQFISVNHSNIYVNLPSTIPLKTINSLQVGLKNDDNKLIANISLKQINLDDVQPYQPLPDGNSKLIYRVPKCCPNYQFYSLTSGCTNSVENFLWNVTIFESNSTGLDPEIRLNSTDYEIRPYYNSLKCNGEIVGISPGELNGLIYNSSLIIEGEGIKLHNEFCMDIMGNNSKEYETGVFVCFLFEEKLNLNFYLPVLIISTICLGLSGALYLLILKHGTEISRMCFIIFSFSLCLAYFCLIILNVQDNSVTCNIFGFLFLISKIFSFIWLFIMCNELLYMVKIPNENRRNVVRWYWYLGISIGITSLMFGVSLFSGNLWIPDVPNTFLKPYDTKQCNFYSVDFDRSLILFLPMGLSVLLSFISLIWSTTIISKNEKTNEIKCSHDWINNSNNYKFVLRTLFIIIVVALTFWLIHICYYFVPLEDRTTQLTLDVLEAAFGIIIFVAFALNKYILAEIKERICKNRKNRITDRMIGLNGIDLPDTPTSATISNTDHDPFLHSSSDNTRR